jgi:MFS family permease
MIAKIIPPDSRGTFFGMQSAVANVLISLAAVGAGYTLDLLKTPLDFAVCFAIASVAYWLSMFFVGQTREALDTAKEIPDQQPALSQGMGRILRADRNFVWFLVMRVVYQFGTMGFAFYIVYGLRHFNMDDVTAGYLTAALTITQTVANAAMGWLSDRVGHRRILIFGMGAVTLSSALAWAAPSLPWMYAVMMISGLANVAYWTIGMAMTVEFGNETDRPVYIGMANTLVAPATILAPILGGWIADAMGFQTTFMISTIGGLVTAALLIFLIKDPRRLERAW